jgi:hypothetical protein
MGNEKVMVLRMAACLDVVPELGSSLRYLDAKRINTRTAWHAFNTPGKISPNVGDDKQPSLIHILFLFWPLFLRTLSLPAGSSTFFFVYSSLVLECKQDRLLSLIR